jgi:hypothetical protein
MLQATIDLSLPECHVRDQLPDVMSVGAGIHRGLLGREVFQDLPNRITVPGVSVHGAVILVENAVDFRHCSS